MQTTSSAPRILGVDGGGTKTVAWLGCWSREASVSSPLGPSERPPRSDPPRSDPPRSDPPRSDPPGGSPTDTETGESQVRVLGRGAAGPSNPRAVGFEQALHNVNAAIDAAFAQAGLRRETVAAACLCIAGVARPSEQQQLRDWLDRQVVAQRVYLAMDAEALLAIDASPMRTSENGIALIAGTGSMAWGRNTHGQTARCGGWGYLLGDEGSAYALALAALQKACQSADGRGRQTSLLPTLLQATDCTSASQLIEWIYQDNIGREQIAGLCHAVFACCPDDASAREIVGSGGQALAEMVATVLRKLDIGGHPYRLVLAGGVLCQQPSYLQWVLNALEQAGQPPASWQLAQQPVAGALQLACRLLLEPMH